MLALKDTDCLLARLQARRSALAEGPRLAALCALGSPGALASAVLPGAGPLSAAAFQAALAARLAAETAEIAACLGGAWGGFAAWQAARPCVENIKTALRRLRSGAGREAADAAMIAAPVPGCGPELAAAGNEEELAALVPQGELRAITLKALSRRKGLFPLEAAIDGGYAAALAEKAAALGGEAGELASALCGQEAAALNLRIAAAGRFVHGFGREDLEDAFVQGPAMDRRRYVRLLSAGSCAELRALSAGSAVDAGPAVSSARELEALAWSRYRKLAVRALRRGHGSPAAAAAYIALRAVETANLISAAEGLRLKEDPVRLAARLVPREEGADV